MIIQALTLKNLFDNILKSEDLLLTASNKVKSVF